MKRIYLERYADVLLWGLTTARKKSYKKNEIVLVGFDKSGLELAEILHDRLISGGQRPVLRQNATWVMEKNFYMKGNMDQLIFIAPGEIELYKHLNGSIHIRGPESITHLAKADPAKIVATALSRKPFREILEKREHAGEFGWTLCMMPTQELANHAGMTLAQYEKEIVRSCFLDQKNPVAYWENIAKKAKRLKKWLKDLKIVSYRMESKNTDLTIMEGKDRQWLGISGHNVPSFELFVSPDYRGTKGVFYADQPSYRCGNYVEGVQLVFAEGNVVKATAKKGAAFLRKQLEMDPGARRVGEFSLTDKRFSNINRFMANTLFDENFGGKWGNSHVALGSSYTDTYTGNLKTLTRKKKEALGFNDSALHWDLVNSEKKQVTATCTNGKKIVIYEDGIFTLPSLKKR